MREVVQRLAPKRAVKELCSGCIGSALMSKIASCGGELVYTTNKPCELYPYREGKRVSVKVFRKFCMTCQGGSSPSIENCIVTDCPAYHYRFGKNPSLTGKRKGQQSRFLRASKKK